MNNPCNDTNLNMESSLPDSLTSTPLAPVAFVGLDVPSASKITGRHNAIWQAFTTDRSPDRVPLKFIASTELEFPPMKPRRTSYEWFIPKGILKTNWMNKHLNLIPSVVVIFIELDWNDPDWNEKKKECATRVQSVRATLAGRGTKVAIVLIQKDPVSDPGIQDVNASERASALCSACELSARSLFVLPTNAENISGFVIRLENAFYELAQNYYHQEIRGVKGHRDYLNKTTHLYLYVRHQFKAGFLNELKGDIHSAYKHYGQAYSLLMEVRATDTNIMEVKTIAGFINYKICKLAFKLNLPRDAISQFRKHMDIFQMKVGLEELAFEHSGWQSEQCKTFAQIFSEAISLGLPAIQTQHPGLYYQQAARYAIKRRQSSEELCFDANKYPSPDPLANASSLEFYGQRPWRPSKVAIEPPDMETERAGIQALQHREKTLTPSHSEVIVGHLKQAIEQYQIFKSPRSESHLTVQMAEELKSAQKYKEALDLLRPIINQYRQEKWHALLSAVLSLGLKCAFLVASISDYVAFALELAYTSNLDKGKTVQSCQQIEETKRIMNNVCNIFHDERPKIPSTEPGLNSKIERLAVGNAMKIWNEMLQHHSHQANSSSKLPPIDVYLNPDVVGSTILDVIVRFDSKKLNADEKIDIFCVVKNNSPANPNISEELTDSSVKIDRLSLPICNIKLCLSSISKDVNAQSSVQENHQDSVVNYQSNDNNSIQLDWDSAKNNLDRKPMYVSPGKSMLQKFEFYPSQKDVGKQIILNKAIITLGRDNNCSSENQIKININYEFPTMNTSQNDKSESFLSYNPPAPLDLIQLSNDEPDSANNTVSIHNKFSSIDIDQRKPQLSMKICANGPILVGEWFVICVKLDNQEVLEDKLTDLVVSMKLIDAGDPLIADTTKLTLDYKNFDQVKTPVTPITPGGSEVIKEFSFMSPPVEKQIHEGLGQKETHNTIFYLRASTTGRRGIEVTVRYSISHYKCELKDTIDFDTILPFDQGSELLSCKRQIPINNAYTDEPFLLLPMIKSLSCHPIKIINSWLEAKHPVEICNKEKMPSQLAQCIFNKDSIGTECFPLIVRKDNLTTTNLDVQEITTGKYVLQWRRNDTNGIDDVDICAKTTFEMSAIKLAISSLYITTSLPPYGVVRTPLQLTYNLINRTDLLQELLVVMEPSDAFMFSGNKQLHIKILPGRSYKLNFILYPLLPGESVLLPQLKLSSVRLTLTEDLTSTLQRLVPRSITVLPKARSKGSIHKEGDKENNDQKNAESNLCKADKPIFIATKLMPRKTK